MLRTTAIVLAIFAAVYVAICILAYFFQERIIFFPERLSPDHEFDFDGHHEEVFITTTGGAKLNGLLFKAPDAKGLIFYLHGNAGSLNSWGDVAATYTRLGYDVFLLDYRGYGKSEGEVTSEDELVQDVRDAYDYLLKSYERHDIVVLGYSLGSGLAAKMAAANQPRLLILQAPYYGLTDMMRHSVPFLPTFLLKYKLRTHEALPACRMPVVLFHGDADEVIPYSQSLKLQTLFKPGDKLITLQGVRHNGMTYEPAYVKAIGSILGGGIRGREE